MASVTHTLPDESKAAIVAVPRDLKDSTIRVLSLVGSLKITVWLIVLAMILVLIGSLAQARKDVWQVVQEYFRCGVAWIDIGDLFPPTIFQQISKTDWSRFPRIPYPGGWTIGVLMLINLVSAHVTKFRPTRNTKQLLGGIVTLTVGAFLTAFIIQVGNQQQGVEFADFIVSADATWYLTLGCLAVGGLVLCVQGVLLHSWGWLRRSVLIGCGLTLLGIFLFLAFGGLGARDEIAAMRILWQLMKATMCSGLLLLGCHLIFGKRGGVVLLHIGVAMLMISEVVVGLYGKEYMLQLMEGDSSNFVQDIRSVELVITKNEGDGKQRIYSIPEDRLIAESGEYEDWVNSRESGERKSDTAPAAGLVSMQDVALRQDAYAARQPSEAKDLPFDISVTSFIRNGRLRPATPSDPVLSHGLGSFATVAALPQVSGTTEKHDQRFVRIDAVDRKSRKILDSALVAQVLSSEMQGMPGRAERITVNGEEYYLYLRFLRSYRPYTVKLLDVTRTNYVGSMTARDFHSRIQIEDPELGGTVEFTPRMNSPLRYKGETFYQSSHDQLGNGREFSALSVVDNRGWMLPYIGCMIVAVGMCSQFWQTLMRFLGRLEDQKDPAIVRSSSHHQDASPNNDLSPWAEKPDALRRPAKPSPVEAEVVTDQEGIRLRTWIVTAACVLSLGLIVAKPAIPRSTPKDSMNLPGFGQLPVLSNGRSMPIDSFARNQLLRTAGKSTFEGELDPAELEAARDRLVARFQKYLAENDEQARELETFRGDYSEWIAKMESLSHKSREEVEEVMRPLMAARMPAIRWLLDVASRPEVSSRHRVLKITDGQILASLGLEQRHGLTYSLAEIEPQLSALEQVRAKAMEKSEQDRENDMTPTERRTAELFSNINHIRTMEVVFGTVSFDSNLFDVTERIWSHQNEVQARTAIRSVFTGSTTEENTAEMFFEADGLIAWQRQCEAAGVRTPEQFAEYCVTTLPSEFVQRDLKLFWQGLSELSADQLGLTSDDADRDSIPRRAAISLARIDDPYFQAVVAMIAGASADDTPDTIFERLEPATVQKLGQRKIMDSIMEFMQTLMASPKHAKKMDDIRNRLRTIMDENADESLVNGMMTREFAQLMFQEILDSRGHLLFDGENAARFAASHDYFGGILAAWRDGNVDGFNSSVKEYQESINANPLPHVAMPRVRLEAWFNQADPLIQATYPYLTAMLLTFLGWLFWHREFRTASMAVLGLAFAVHCGGLIIRYMISGRPPVTNLYSSAIFIGWGLVIFGFGAEFLLKRGIGNLIGAVSGASSLMIAHYLARDEGDTIGVMQAVLDTQFWLATHVVSITLGYTATLAAGFLAIGYLLYSRFVSPSEEKREFLRLFDKSVYGVVCFAIFFSLVGTILGGLWADDSWGRFWGWDPKENGALLIVLWNALVLHARWDKMVTANGTAILAIGGNIVTAWSWFGVNALNAGLHAYGSSGERMFALTTFFVSQLAIIVAALLIPPRSSKESLAT
ncbi:MAG: cytochrome c biogenesis protein CcsA [Planctomycetaceae bacterium]|nr:cytochrome c biogenesis protein CcsA [Planctomycetaceae bacterium]